MRKGVVRVKRLWAAVCICAALMPRASALSASAAVTMDADTGETLFASNADSRLPMASTTKIMTALVALTVDAPRFLAEFKARMAHVLG